MIVDRTAEEFVHQLPDGRWFVGDFVRTDDAQRAVFLVEQQRRRGLGVELPIAVIATPAGKVVSYACKSSAKRAAQRMIERVLDMPG